MSGTERMQKKTRAGRGRLARTGGHCDQQDCTGTNQRRDELPTTSERVCSRRSGVYLAEAIVMPLAAINDSSRATVSGYGSPTA